MMGNGNGWKKTCHEPEKELWGQRFRQGVQAGNGSHMHQLGLGPNLVVYKRVILNSHS